jgi:hypothetical protein
MDGNESKRITSLLELTRNWIRIRYELEHKTAKIACMQRALLKEAWLRITNRDISRPWLDIFELDITTISNALLKPVDESNLGAILARTKHKRWLETRILPPTALALESTDDLHNKKNMREPIQCKESFGSQIRGSLKLVDAYEQVSELHPDDIALFRYPALAWSTAMCNCSGIVCEYMPDVPPESLHCTEYQIPSVYGCKNAIHTLSNSKRILVDGDSGFVKPV